MRKKSQRILVILTSLVFIFLATSFVFAETKLENPLGTNVDPRLIIGSVIKAILGIVGSLALAMIIFGGFMWVIAGGNDEKIKKGKDMITWAALGLVVIFASYALVTFVINAVTGSGASGDSRANPENSR